MDESTTHAAAEKPVETAWCWL